MKTDDTRMVMDLEFRFRGLEEPYLQFLEACARPMHFLRDERFVREGEVADSFYLLHAGMAALELTAGNRRVNVQTLGAGELLGWSWLVPPHRWRFDARAVTDLSCIHFNAVRVRTACEDDPIFGYEMYKRFTPIIADRLVATRVQVLEIYR